MNHLARIHVTEMVYYLLLTQQTAQSLFSVTMVKHLSSCAQVAWNLTHENTFVIGRSLSVVHDLLTVRVCRSKTSHSLSSFNYTSMEIF